MKIEATVTPKAKQNSVEQISGNHYKIKTTAPAQNGKANKAALELIAEHFGVKVSAIEIISGESYRNKVIEIEKED